MSRPLPKLRQPGRLKLSAVWPNMIAAKLTALMAAKFSLGREAWPGDHAALETKLEKNSQAG